MSQYKSQVQNQFLSFVRKRHTPIEIVLNTGTTLRGKLKGYDQFSVTLTFKDKVEVIYKSAILYISALPQRQKPYGERSSSPRPRFNSDRPPRRNDYPDDRENDPPPPKKTPRY